MSIKKIQEHYLLILILILAFALRLFYLNQFGFWSGEIHTIFHSPRPLVEIPIAYRDNTAHPPLWFILTHFLLKFNTGTWLVRLPSVLLGITSIGVGYAFVDRFFNRKWALGAAWLLTIMPISLRWSQSARMYTAFLLLSILSYIFTLDILQPSKKHAWIGFSIVSLLNLYTHYFSVIPLLVSWLFLLIMVINKAYIQLKQENNRPLLSDLPRPKLKIPKGADFLFQRLAYSIAAIGVGYFPWAWFVARYNFIDRQMTREARETAVGLDLDAYYRLFEDLVGGLNSWFIWIILALVIGGGLFLLWKKRTQPSTYLTLMMILIPILIVVIFSPRRFHGRYLIFMLPFVAILLMAGLTGFQEEVVRWLKTQNWDPRFSFLPVGLVLAFISAQYLAVDNLYFKADGDFFYQTRSDPKNWKRRGLWNQWQDDIKEPYLVMVAESSLANIKKQLATMIYASSELQEHHIGWNWRSVDEFDLWFILPEIKTKDGTITFPPACGIPVQEAVINGPNQSFLRTHLEVVSLEPLLTNGSFEEVNFTLDENNTVLIPGWSFSGKGAQDIQAVSTPVFEGERAIMFPHLSGDGKTRKILTTTSDLVYVEPGSILLGSIQVQNPVLLYHNTIPQLSILFYDAEGNKLNSDKDCPTFESILPDPGIPGWNWQVIYTQVVVPENARQAAISLKVKPNSVTANPIFVDDIRLDSIEWALHE